MSDYEKMWNAFENAWDRLCDYHKEQALDIQKALKRGWLEPSQALVELQAIKHEQAMCKKGCA